MEVAAHMTHAEALLEELIAFCRDQGAPCFVGWPENILREYLLFHHANGSLAFVRRAGRVIGLAVGWQCNGTELEKHWQTWNWAGDTFLFSQVVCAEPGALKILVREFQTRVPFWRHLTLVARRFKRGKLVTYPAKFIERMAA